MNYELLYAGFDTLDVAFAGALRPSDLKTLETARQEAQESQEEVLTTIGPGNVEMHVLGYGKRGGYAYICDTGPLGAKWMFKNSIDTKQWNVFASPSATMLLAYGYEGTRKRLWESLQAMGAKVTEHSINRADFAMDFQTRGFQLHLDQFVAHSHTKIGTHWGKLGEVPDLSEPGAVFRGGQLKSVTIGKQPGRQIIVYDKRGEAVEKKKHFWFEAWKRDRRDPELEVQRVEVRAGKHELKEKYQIRTFDDFEAGIGDVISNSLESIRFLADGQTDSNVSRQALHPIWVAAQKVVSGSLCSFHSGLTPNQVREILKERAIEQYRTLCLGNAIGFGVASGISGEVLMEQLPTMVFHQLTNLIENEKERVAKSVSKIQQRVHFIEEPQSRGE